MLKNEYNMSDKIISMIIPTITNIWDIIDLIFRKNYKDVISLSTFKLLLLSKKNNLQIAIPYWEFYDDENDIDYLELEAIPCAPFYDEHNKCFIFKNIIQLFNHIQTIQFQLMKMYPLSEDHKYKLFIINTINKEINVRINPNNSDATTDISDLLNQLVI